ncbi:hypothetical protein [Pseudoalteromonas spongiae]|uniref:hypothetical protein n=1 Tax=Pseudoalteromonas spongiae TaxID=298657 RepID=UPI00110AAFCE|nr:hypothetical protein [Pseudoalteromonas spongiae]TMO83072.1 hypothetical protein CWC15_16565 [Pseudoalteromonas spongiae]
MAKKKNERFTYSSAKHAKSATENECYTKEYSEFIIVDTNCSNKPTKIWFQKNSETWYQAKKNGYILRKGKLANGWLVDYESRDTITFKKQLAILYKQWALKTTYSQKELTSVYYTLEKFIHYCISENAIKSLEEIDPDLIRKFNQEKLPGTQTFDLKKIFSQVISSSCFRKHNSYNDKKALNSDERILEELLDEKGYPDKVLVQLIAFAVYHFNFMKERWSWLLNADEEKLSKKGYLLEWTEFQDLKKPKDDSALGKIFRLWEYDKIESYKILHQNFLVLAKALKFNNGFTSKKITPKNSYFSKILSKAERYKKGFHTGFIEYVKIMYERKFNDGGKLDFKRNYLLTFPACQASIFVLLFCQLGANKQILKTLKRLYDGKSWKENFDVNLGVDSQTILQHQIVRISGKKVRGVKAKEIAFRVPIKSFLFEVLDLWEAIFSDKNSEVFFNSINRGSCLKPFASLYPIYNENMERISSIDSTKFRKSFVGVELAKTLDSAENAEQLSYKLKESLHHNSFDTTITNYIMKTGAGHIAYSSAVVALTTKMLEDALSFKGKISHRTEESNEYTPVYLCDCSNNQRPTHNIPIAKKCTHYDLCLGCERSVVYAEHIPKICFRLMQYNEMKRPTLDIVADRKAIALDCLEKFRQSHPDGDIIVDHGYEVAKEAMLKHTPLLPPLM